MILCGLLAVLLVWIIVVDGSRTLFTIAQAVTFVVVLGAVSIIRRRIVMGERTLARRMRRRIATPERATLTTYVGRPVIMAALGALVVAVVTSVCAILAPGGSVALGAITLVGSVLYAAGARQLIRWIVAAPTLAVDDGSFQLDRELRRRDLLRALSPVPLFLIALFAAAGPQVAGGWPFVRIGCIVAGIACLLIWLPSELGSGTDRGAP
ncbi:hypothetical protein BKA23_1137 [Rudaeicoccus suwonensis]|uniref:Uncharacterized protein n=2 Tax=Rudaeicoccus suwonensis TaxID=657409 RepID=A0A561E9N7_9MICO|nr:hypothetical protein BKA23_1137 [Rudaeicoccus suwonensis]